MSPCSKTHGLQWDYNELMDVYKSMGIHQIDQNNIGNINVQTSGVWGSPFSDRLSKPTKLHSRDLNKIAIETHHFLIGASSIHGHISIANGQNYANCQTVL